MSSAECIGARASMRSRTSDGWIRRDGLGGTKGAADRRAGMDSWTA